MIRKYAIVIGLFVLLDIWAVTPKKTKKSLNMDWINMRDWNLPGDSAYTAVYQLSANNFKHKIQNSDDAWIIVVYKDKLQSKWIRHAQRLKAAVWYGSIDYNKEKELADELVGNVSSAELKSGIGFVYPFNRTRKPHDGVKVHNWPMRIDEPSEAASKLRLTFPRRITALTFKSNETENLEQWIVNAYYKSQPPRFPIICVTDEPKWDIPISVLSISHYFSSYFSFGVVWKEDEYRLLSTLKQIPHPKKYPQFLTLLGKEPTEEQMKIGKFGLTFDIFPFNADKYGESEQFLAVVKYLFTTNEDYREVLLGRQSDESIDVQKMESTRKALTNRLKIVSKNYDVLIKNEL